MAGNSAYRYKYNGKELQIETGMYDYGATFYIPILGDWVWWIRWRRSTEDSTYNYAVNNPIMFTDPDGMQINPVKDGLKYL